MRYENVHLAIEDIQKGLWRPVLCPDDADDGIKGLAKNFLFQHWGPDDAEEHLFWESRQYVVKDMRTQGIYFVKADSPLDAVKRLPDEAKRFPPGPRKKGRWEPDGFRCDQCGCRADKKTAFCPGCGADMRKAPDGQRI